MSQQASKLVEKDHANDDAKSDFDVSLDAPPPYELYSSGSVLASSTVVNGTESFKRPGVLRTLTVLKSPRRA